jgi:tryptophan 2,3-dioxygenase
MENKEEVQRLLQKLNDKYNEDGQPAEAYLEGLLYSEYVDYWHYINLDALLSLQHPRTVIKDEMIFIMYHQITELYFKLCLWEYDQILKQKEITAGFITARLQRIVNYFSNLTRSFGIMVDGMEPEQFLKFRLALLPASGFQSAQYRMIEMASTDLINLVNISEREKVLDASVEEQYNFIYWKYGATIAETGEKTLTLKRFEKKYADILIGWAREHENNNLRSLYRNLDPTIKEDPEVINMFKELDLMVNVRWPAVHLKSAQQYLKRPHTLAATGGTNWEKYLPPRIQRRIFFPELWTDTELANWGKIGNIE